MDGAECQYKSKSCMAQVIAFRILAGAFILLLNAITYLLVARRTHISGFDPLPGNLLGTARQQGTAQQQEAARQQGTVSLQDAKQAALRRYWIHGAVYDSVDESPRCMSSHICDGQAVNSSCDGDGVGCITSSFMRQKAIRRAMKDSWETYRQHAWGHDELQVQGDGNLSFRDWQNQGITIIDAMSTLLLMNMTDEYRAARDWAMQADQLANVGRVSVFETNIRAVGGLLSAYTLSGKTDDALLKKAQQVADRSLLPVSVPVDESELLQTVAENGVLKLKILHKLVSTRGSIQNLAEAGSYILEMTSLSHLTGNPAYANAADRFYNRLDSLPSCNGLYCTWFDPNSMQCQDQSYGFGANADSMYEYMLKQWILSNKKHMHMLPRYSMAVLGMRRHLIKEIKPCNGAQSSKQTVGDTEDAQTNAVSTTSDVKSGTHETGVQPRTTLRDSAARNASMGPTYWHASFWVVAEGRRIGECPKQTPMSWIAASPGPAQAGQDDAATVSSSRSTTAYGLGHQTGSMQQGTTSLSTSMHSTQPSKAVRSALEGISRHSITRHSIRTAAMDQQVQHPTDTPVTSGPDSTSPSDAVTSPPSVAAAIALQLHVHHLSCFLPGLIALGHIHGVNSAVPRTDPAFVRITGVPDQAQVVDDLLLAANLMRGCYELYRNSETGVTGDEADWLELQEGGYLQATCHKLHYRITDSFLRPEVVESLFYLWRATQDPIYRDWGWQIFRSHYEHSRLPSGAYATMKEAQAAGPINPRDSKHQAARSNKKEKRGQGRKSGREQPTTRAIRESEGTQPNLGHKSDQMSTRNNQGDQQYSFVTCMQSATIKQLHRHGDRQESFWLAETLKYLYLLFSDDPTLLPLDKWVLNTEAHPLPIWD